jgi:hypothetical protein
MKLHLVSTHFFMAAVCICLALLISSPIHSQSAAATTQQWQTPQAGQQTSWNDSLKEDWGGQIGEYGSFPGIADECKEYQQDVDKGEDPRRESFWLRYMQMIGLREDEAQAMCTIAIDANNRTNEFETQFYAAHGGRDNFLRTFPSPEHTADLQALWHQKRRITFDAIAKMKQALGPESFRRLDEYYYRSYYYGRHNLKYPETPAPRTFPSRPSEMHSAPAQAPEVHP